MTTEKPQQIRFSIPPLAGSELQYIQDALDRQHLCGDGHYSSLCHRWISENVGGACARLTHSCTAALEIAAMLCDVREGDEVIMPSFTFVSTANAFVLRGAIPVFVDVRPDTLNIDESLIEAAITARTKAIVAVHYAGVCAEMDAIRAVAKRHQLIVVEDAAQALLSTYHGRPAGALSAISCFSFHETKNIVSGEGGAIVVNDDRFVERTDVLREKGTNRAAFHAGMVDKYSWVDIGSSFLPGEIVAAFLWAQLQEAARITSNRRTIWSRYHYEFADLERLGLIRRPIVPSHCEHNGHMYYLLLPDRLSRDALIRGLGDDGILAPFHYVPLHSSPAGLKYGRVHGNLQQTEVAGANLIRLPLFESLGDRQGRVIDRVLKRVRSALD